MAKNERILNNEQMHALVKELYPNKKFDLAVNEMKELHLVTVLKNNSKSSRKRYFLKGKIEKEV